MELKHIYLKSQLHRVIFGDLKAGMLSHCYLLSGADEIVVNTFARLVAKEIFCVSKNGICDECLNCQKVSHNNMVDLITYPKGDKGLVVDDINEIVSDAFVRPVEAEYKIYILKNFDDATIQAQNKILKTLEEPPKNIIFILTTTNIDLVLPTILSRAKKVEVNLLEKNDLIDILKGENVDNASTLSSLSGGNLTTALALSGTKDASQIVDLAFDMLCGLNSSKDVLVYSSKIIALKKNVPLFLNLVTRILRDSLVDVKYRDFDGMDNTFIRLKSMYNAKTVSKIVSHISSMFLRMDFNCNMSGLIDEMLLKILEVRFLCQ